jgi:thioredoxin:protein disulfide reductase
VGTSSVALPKSGLWLARIKNLFGLVMIVAALYCLCALVPGRSQVVQPTAAHLMMALALLCGGLALGAIQLPFRGATPLLRARKGAGIAFAVAGLYGLVGYTEARIAGAKLEWRDDFAHASMQAHAQKRPLLVGFGAARCRACGELDRHTFSDPRVVRESRRFISVKIDLSLGRDTPAKQQLLAGYAARDLPLVVLHDSSGNVVARVTRFVPADEMLALMQRAH